MNSFCDLVLIRVIVRRILPALLLLTLVGLSPVMGQTTRTGVEWDPEGLQMTRSGLQALLDDLQEVAGSSAYSSRLRERARQDAELIRERLSTGDFRVGDRVLLAVEGEPQLPDTVPVQPGPEITLPVLGTISLQGVLRSELEEHLTNELSVYIREPVVRAEALIRVSIQGNVGSPGFYTVPAQMLIGEALMRAGGPTQSSDLEELEVQRGDRILWSGLELRDAMVEGRTLDQLNLRAGDQIVVPVQPERAWWTSALSYGIPIATSVFLGIRLTRGF